MDVVQDRPGRAALAVLLCGLAGSASWLVLAPRTDLSVHLQTGWAAQAALVPALATVVVLVWRLPRHGVTRVLTVSVLAHHLMLTTRLVAEHGTGRSGADRFLELVSAVAWIATLPLLAVLLVVFPAGRPPGRLWRGVLAAQGAALSALAVAVLLAPEGDPTGPAAVLAIGAGAVLFSSAVAASLRHCLTFRRLPADERARGRLFVVLAGLVLSSYLVLPLLPQGLLSPSYADDLGYALLVGGFPTVIGISVLRHRLFGLELVVRRALVAGLAGAALLTAYLLTATGVAAAGGPAVGQPTAALLPALLVVAVLAPVTALARQAVDRSLYGERAEPQRALRRLTEALVGAVAPTQVPELVARQVQQALRVPWTAVEIDDEGSPRLLATAGLRGTGALVRTDLVRGGDRFGALVVEVRPGDKALHAADHELLRRVADQAAVGLESVQLTQQLLQSRERLVAAREAERLRLRRDLHDDLSPALAGMVLALDAGRRVLRSDPAAGEALLERVATEARSCGAVVRGLLEDLRPPGLAELGLLASVEDLAARLHRPGEFEVRVRADEPLPPVSEAVEVAAYRVAGEALSNAARHARARRCELRLHGAGELVLEVSDDGCGLAASTAGTGSGLGLASMLERARDVGGTLDVSSAAGGTTVTARLPALPAQRQP